MFTMCLKFQLTNKSARCMVANAICTQSSKLVSPTTFSRTYIVARAWISGVMTTFSLSVQGNSSKNFLTCSGAFVNSLSEASEYRHRFVVPLPYRKSWLSRARIRCQTSRPTRKCQCKTVVSYPLCVHVTAQNYKIKLCKPIYQSNVSVPSLRATRNDEARHGVLLC